MQKRQFFIAVASLALLGGCTATHAGITSGGSPSVGWLAGAESKAVYSLIMTPEALQRFRQSKGWTIGADASVTIIDTGATASIDTQTAGKSTIGYVLSSAGLMAGISLDGSKITPLVLAK